MVGNRASAKGQCLARGPEVDRQVIDFDPLIISREPAAFGHHQMDVWLKLDYNTLSVIEKS
jgi:hypothetical protein